MIKISKAYTFAALTSFCLAVNAAPIDSNHVIVGMYKPSNANAGQLTVVTQNSQNGTWDQRVKFNDVPSMLGMTATSIACQGNNCFIPGKIQLTGNRYWSLMGLHSEDAGKTWSAKTTFNHLPADLRNPWTIYTPGCFDGACFVVNGYLSKNGISPLLMRSEDAGKTWDFINTLHQEDEGTINELVCHDKTCVLTGYFMEKNHSRLLILRSDTHGLTWKDNITIKGLHDGNDKEFSRIAYYDHQYFVTGSYMTKQGWAKPYILRSTDDGKSWLDVTHISGFPTASEIDLGKTHCSGTSCIITGSYNNILKDQNGSFVLVSHDQGKTWTANKQVLGKTSISINDITYSHHTWLLSGSVLDSLSPGHPLMMASYDEGNTWHYIPLPSVENFSLGTITQVKCEENTCYALGTSVDDSRKERGVLYESANHGQTWSVAKINFLADVKESWFSDLSK